MDSLLTEVMEEGREGFIVDSDSAAEWALDRIREARASIKRYETLAQEKTRAIQEQLDKAVKPEQNRIEHFEYLLGVYMRSLDVKPTKSGSKIYRLLSGKLTTKPQAPEFVLDNDTLAAWLVANGRTDMVKETIAPKWEELKKVCTAPLPDGTVCTTDGEVILGVTAVIRPDKFIVEVD